MALGSNTWVWSTRTLLLKETIRLFRLGEQFVTLFYVITSSLFCWFLMVNLKKFVFAVNYCLGKCMDHYIFYPRFYLWISFGFVMGYSFEFSGKKNNPQWGAQRALFFPHIKQHLKLYYYHIVHDDNMNGWCICWGSLGLFFEQVRFKVKTWTTKASLGIIFGVKESVPCTSLVLNISKPSPSSMQKLYVWVLLSCFQDRPMFEKPVKIYN